MSYLGERAVVKSHGISADVGALKELTIDNLRRDGCRLEPRIEILHWKPNMFADPIKVL
jgi:hypothetical protein